MQRNKWKDQVVFPIGTSWELSLFRGRSAAKRASYSLISHLNPVLSSGCLHLLGLNNSPRHQRHKVPGNGLKSLVNALQGEGCFKKQSGVFVPKL